MGFFKSIKDNYKKSEAAVVVQNLLEEASRMEMFPGNASKTANLLVGGAWDELGDLLDGRRGVRPHKIAIAAISIARAIELADATKAFSTSHAFAFCLSKILAEVGQNGVLYTLNQLDMKLLNKAGETFSQFATATEMSPIGQEVSGFMGRNTVTWEDWYQLYKAEAVAANPTLQHENGLSILDFLEDEPLRRAHRDGLDPKQLGREHADVYSTPEFLMKLMGNNPSGSK
ncbi:MAG: hypothetical protein V7774_06655 [Pseudorhizobium pelagicum]|uniref:hypothetical protein n=1 Tax=Pseudorhizobium pelagicum TaxID=1509405 RepID=UPI003460ED42